MKVLASLTGSGAGAIVIGLCWVAGRHYRHLPPRAHAWVERALIVLMFAGGSAVAVTELGGWVTGAALWLAGWLGGVAYGIAHAALVVTAAFLLAALAVALAVAPSQRTGWLAALMPLVLALVPGGFLHSADVTLTVPARALATALSAWIGG